jgi:hypothetical protein
MSAEYPTPPGLTEEEWVMVLRRREQATHDRGYNRAIHEACMHVEGWKGSMRDLAQHIRDTLFRKPE